MTAKHEPGRPAGLTRPEILAKAIAIADREGLERLTMRRLAAELGVEAMSLYHHVPNKAALLDGMVEQVVTHTPLPSRRADSRRAALREFADALRESLIAHRSVIPLLASRPAMTSGNLSAVEAALAMLTEAGFTPGRALHAVRSLICLVLGHVVVETEPDAASGTSVSGTDPAIDAEPFPLLAAGTEALAAESPREQFLVAVDALLIGFDQAGR